MKTIYQATCGIFLLLNFVAQAQLNEQFSFSVNEVETGQANGYCNT